jgi:hypothetical protein
MGDIAVRQLTWRTFKPGTLRIDSEGVGTRQGAEQTGSYPWDQVRQVCFDEPGRAKASVQANALIGVLGLSGRTEYSLITVSVEDKEDKDLFFATPHAMVRWRAMSDRMLDQVPELAAKLTIDGAAIGVDPYPAAATAPAQAASPAHRIIVIEDIGRLGDLKDSGRLTPAEFNAKKAELLTRL